MVRYFEEGFDTGTSTCPTNAVTGFLSMAGQSPTIAKYETVNEPISIDFKWATRMTPPQLSELSTLSQRGILNDGEAALQSSQTSMIYHNVEYQLNSIQISKATHSNWLVDTADQAKNRADLIFTFKSRRGDSYFNYVLFVIPMVESITALVDPPYLRAITGEVGAQQAGGYTFKNFLLPTANTKFAYYSTCLSASGSGKYANATVFVSIAPLQVSKTLLDSLKVKISASATEFPSAYAPSDVTISATPTPFGSTFSFSSVVLSTDDLLRAEDVRNVMRSSSQNAVNQVDTGAFKCVMLDPDANIQENQVLIDKDTGELRGPVASGPSLTDLINQRTAARENADKATTLAGAQPFKVAPGTLGNIVAGIVGGIIGLLFLYFIGTVVYGYLKRPGAAAVSGAAAAAVGAVASTDSGLWTFIKSTSGTIMLAILIGLAGFLLGLLLR